MLPTFLGSDREAKQTRCDQGMTNDNHLFRQFKNWKVEQKMKQKQKLREEQTITADDLI